MQQDRSIGIGIAVGIVLAVVGIADYGREIWISMVTPPSARLPNPLVVFSAYLVQTAILTWLCFRAYTFRNYGLSAAAWILATWEAIGMTTRSNLLDMKHAQPGLYGITAFLHVLGAASLFLAMGVRAHQNHRQARRDDSYASQEYIKRPRG